MVKIKHIAAFALAVAGLFSDSRPTIHVYYDNSMESLMQQAGVNNIAIPQGFYSDPNAVQVIPANTGIVPIIPMANTGTTNTAINITPGTINSGQPPKQETATTSAIATALTGPSAITDSVVDASLAAMLQLQKTREKEMNDAKFAASQLDKGDANECRTKEDSSSSGLFGALTAIDDKMPHYEPARKSGNSKVDTLIEGVKIAGDGKIYYRFYAKDGTQLEFKKAVKRATAAWEKVANVHFIEATGAERCRPVHIEFSQNFDPSDKTDSTSDIGQMAGITISSTYIMPGKKQLVRVIIKSNREYAGFTDKDHPYHALIHEIGHALGLKHDVYHYPGDEGPYLSTEEDNGDYTVMSYNPKKSDSTYPSKPMQYDIYAAQYLYGAANNLTNIASGL